MNNYYGGSSFPGNQVPNNPSLNNQVYNNSLLANASELPMEQSYIENILRLNKGKKVKVYMTFPDSADFRDREFNGIVEESGRDHIIISDPTTGIWHLLLMIYVDYIDFDERINYSQEFVPNN
jgi:spore germination protein Q